VRLTGAILSSVADHIIEVGAPEATKIQSHTEAFETAVSGSTNDLKATTAEYVSKVRAEITAWRSKEGETANQIEQKKLELLKHGIRLDMPFIQKLVADEARARENVKNLQTWVPELERLRREHTQLLKARWAGRRMSRACGQLLRPAHRTP